jgi:hypothetical protein
MTDRFYLWLANHLPRRLAYWCAMRLWVHGTTGAYGATVVPELTVLDALRRWDPR